MTLKELKARVDAALSIDGRNDGLEVCIPNHKGGMGGTSVTKVVGAGTGIDWDRGKYFILPEKEMVERKSPVL